MKEKLIALAHPHYNLNQNGSVFNEYTILRKKKPFEL